MNAFPMLARCLQLQDNEPAILQCAVAPSQAPQCRHPVVIDVLDLMTRAGDVVEAPNLVVSSGGLHTRVLMFKDG